MKVIHLTIELIVGFSYYLFLLSSLVEKSSIKLHRLHLLLESCLESCLEMPYMTTKLG